MVDDCIFCRIVKGEIPCTKIFEDELVLAFLDINPWSQGHSLVIPKAHFSRLEDCPGSVLAAVAEKLPLLTQALVQATDAQGFNLLNNNGRAAGQLVDHVHFHIIPRNQGDDIIQHAPQGEYPPGRMDALAAQIRSLIR